MTPIEKNIRVVDEQGNEYEATYPKRAKGLVKNGRARFVDEHTLCLACPPNQQEENKMTENESIVQTVQEAFTAKDIFEKIAELQKQMSESSNFSVHGLAEAISSLSVDDDTDQRTEQIELITSVYIQREFTFRQMLSLYEKMYSDLIMLEMQSEKSPEETIIAEMVEIIKNNPDPIAKGDAMSVIETYFELHS